MRKSKFTESQIVTTLNQGEGGRQIKRRMPRVGHFRCNLLRLEVKYGGVEAADVEHLWNLEAEH